MKKLLAILVITVFAATAMMAVDNPFSFSLSAKFQGKFKDDSQAGYMSLASGDDGQEFVGDKDNNYITKNVSLKAELDAGMSVTLAEIYTLSFGICEKPEISSDNAENEVNFKIMGNSIKVIQDYLTIGLDIKYNIFHKEANEFVNSRLDFVFSLSGSVPDTGFSWKLSSDNRLKFDLENYKDTDPLHGETAANRDGDNGSLFDAYYAEHKLELKWEFLHFFAPENITCTLIIDPCLKPTINYSPYVERFHTIETETNPGIELGLAGFNIGLKCYIATKDTIGVSAPAGSAGSAWDYKKDAATGAADNDDESGYDYEGDTNGDGTIDKWVDNENNKLYPWRTPSGTLKVGPKLTLGFTKGMGSFGFMWKGYASNLRDVNWMADNKHNSVWTNEFEIDVKIAF
jgi:hypothetical protein